LGALVDQSVIAVLAFFHIAAAIGWMGGLVFFLSAVGPGVRTLSPAASLEFLTKAGPRQTRYFAGAATGTIVFGLALAFAAFGSVGSWPTAIYGGMTMGLIAYVIAIGVTIPTFRKAEKVAHEIMTSQGPPSPDQGAKLGALLKRGNMSTIGIAIFLVLALAFMVDSGFG
jgi:hypothetical protein